MKARRSAYDELDLYIKGFETSPLGSGTVDAKVNKSERKMAPKTSAIVKTQPNSAINKQNAPDLEDTSFQMSVTRLDDEIEHFTRKIESMRSSRLQQLRQMRQSMLSDITFSENLDAATTLNTFDTHYLIDEEFQSFLLGESNLLPSHHSMTDILPEQCFEALSHLQIQRKAHRSKLRQLSKNIEGILSQSAINTNKQNNHMQQIESQTQQNFKSHFGNSPMSARTGSDSETDAVERMYRHEHKHNSNNTSKNHKRDKNNTSMADMNRGMRQSPVIDIFADDITGSPPLPPLRCNNYNTTNKNMNTANVAKKNHSNDDSVMEGFLTHSRSQSQIQSSDDNHEEEVPSLAEVPHDARNHSRRYLIPQDRNISFHPAYDNNIEEEEEEFDLFKLASSHLDQFMDDDDHNQSNQERSVSPKPKTPTSKPSFS